MREFVGSDGKTYHPYIAFMDGEYEVQIGPEHPDFPAAVRALGEMVEEDHTSSTVANHIFSLWDAAK